MEHLTIIKKFVGIQEVIDDGQKLTAGGEDLRRSCQDRRLSSGWESFQI